MEKEKKKAFENARIGDRVWDFIFGWGTIQNINYNSLKPIQVVFDNQIGDYNFTLEGKFTSTDINPFLFWDEIKFNTPEKTCKYATSNPITNEKLKNGDKEVEKIIEKTFEVFKDNVNSPTHYKLNISGHDIEVIDIIRAILTPEEFRGYLKGNTIKYIMRESNKNHIEDLEKCDKYLDWLIKKDKEEKDQ